jgi:hypothetical protein
MRYEVKSVGVWAFVRISFFLNLIIGFLIGLLYAAMLGVIFAAAESVGEFGDLPFDPSRFGAALIIILPVLFAAVCAVFNTLLGVIMIVAYNLIVKMTGGFEMTLEPVATPTAPAAAAPMQSTPPPPPPAWNPPPPPPTFEPPRNGGPEQG